MKPLSKANLHNNFYRELKGKDSMTSPRGSDTFESQNSGLDPIQALKEQNQQLKSKVSSLQLALDKAIQAKQNRTNVGGSVDTAFSNNQAIKVMEKQSDVHKRLNDLLNQKDDEILKLTQKIMELQNELDEARDREFESPDRNKKGYLSSPGQGGYVPKHGYAPMKEMENKLKDAERQISELQTEIKALNKVQSQQSKALTEISNEEGNQTRVKALLEDLRIQKDQNKILKSKLYDAEKAALQSHEKATRLLEQIKNLNQNGVVREKPLTQRSQSVAAASNLDAVAHRKIEELSKANAILSRDKTRQQESSKKQKDLFSKQMQKLHLRIEYLTAICEEYGIPIEEA